MLINSFIHETPLGLFVKDIDDNFRYVIANNVQTKMNLLGHSNRLNKTDYNIFDKPIADLFRLPIWG